MADVDVIEDPVARAKAKMLDKAKSEADRREEDAEMHRAAEKMAAERINGELSEVMALADEQMAQRIRLESAILVLRDAGSLYGAQKQRQLDEKTLELARYAILGQA